MYTLFLYNNNIIPFDELFSMCVLPLISACNLPSPTYIFNLIFFFLQPNANKSMYHGYFGTVSIFTTYTFFIVFYNIIIYIHCILYDECSYNINNKYRILEITIEGTIVS